MAKYVLTIWENCFNCLHQKPIHGWSQWFQENTLCPKVLWKLTKPWCRTLLSPWPWSRRWQRMTLLGHSSLGEFKVGNHVQCNMVALRSRPNSRNAMRNTEAEKCQNSIIVIYVNLLLLTSRQLSNYSSISKLSATQYRLNQNTISKNLSSHWQGGRCTTSCCVSYVPLFSDFRALELCKMIDGFPYLQKDSIVQWSTL